MAEFNQQIRLRRFLELIEVRNKVAFVDRSSMRFTDKQEMLFPVAQRIRMKGRAEKRMAEQMRQQGDASSGEGLVEVDPFWGRKEQQLGGDSGMREHRKVDSGWCAGSSAKETISIAIRTDFEVEESPHSQVPENPGERSTQPGELQGSRSGDLRPSWDHEPLYLASTSDQYDRDHDPDQDADLLQNSPSEAPQISSDDTEYPGMKTFPEQRTPRIALPPYYHGNWIRNHSRRVAEEHHQEDHAPLELTVGWSSNHDGDQVRDPDPAVQAVLNTPERHLDEDPESSSLAPGSLFVRPSSSAHVMNRTIAFANASGEDIIPVYSRVSQAAAFQFMRTDRVMPDMVYGRQRGPRREDRERNRDWWDDIWRAKK